MNAVVLSVRDGKSAVLLKDGTIRNINRECKVGETVRVSTRQSMIVKYAGMAAAAIVMFATGLGGYNYQTASAVSYVTLDVNPSIQYSLNRQNAVIAIEPLNDDAQPIVASVVENTAQKAGLDVAITNTLTALNDNNYLNNENGNVLLFDVASDDSVRSSKLVDTINGIADTNSNDDYHIIESSLDDHEAAVSNNMSTGRYAMMVSELEANGVGVDASSVDAYKTMKVRDMVSVAAGGVKEETDNAADTDKGSANDGKETGNAVTPQQTVTAVPSTGSTSTQQTTGTQTQSAPAESTSVSHTGSSSDGSSGSTSGGSSSKKVVITDTSSSDGGNDSVSTTPATSSDSGTSGNSDTSQGSSDSGSSSGSSGKGKSGGSNASDTDDGDDRDSIGGDEQPPAYEEPIQPTQPDPVDPGTPGDDVTDEPGSGESQTPVNTEETPSDNNETGDGSSGGRSSEGSTGGDGVESLQNVGTDLPEPTGTEGDALTVA